MHSDFHFVRDHSHVDNSFHIHLDLLCSNACRSFSFVMFVLGGASRFVAPPPWQPAVTDPRIYCDFNCTRAKSLGKRIVLR